ncbi:hypothetical protein Peur_031992 [Populus x canadensis]
MIYPVIWPVAEPVAELSNSCKHCKVQGPSTKACSKGKEEANTVEKAGPANVATKDIVKGKGSVFTQVDAPPAAAHPVEGSPAASPVEDGPELVAPSTPSDSCVAQDVQPCPQVTNTGSEEWQTIRGRRHSSGNKRQPPSLLPAVRNLPSKKVVSSKGKAIAFSVQTAGHKASHCPGSASAKLNGCPLAVSCEDVRWCLAGSFDVHGYCMVSRPCIDDPLRLGYLSRFWLAPGRVLLASVFPAWNGSWQAVGFPLAGR